MNTKLLRKILAVTITSFALLAIATPLAAEEPIDKTEYPYCCNSDSELQRGRYSRRSNTEKVETIDAEVVEVNRYSSRGRMSQGVHLLVNTGDDTVEVHLAPSWYLEERNFAIAPEDKIAITGSRIDVDGESAIIARQIKKGNETLTLRDEEGYPLWRGAGRGWRR
jgi:hypothetical protein